MRPIRFLIITILSFVTILNEAFFKRLISLLLCGILGFNSTACYGFWQTSTSPAQASQPLESPPPTQPNPTIAQIPRVRQQNQPTTVQPSESTIYPSIDSSLDNSRDSSSRQAQPSAGGTALFSKSFKRISDDTAELRLINSDGCNFITTFKRTQEGTYRESIQFVPKNIEVCQLEPFTADIAPDGNKLELQLENSGESLEGV
jgi:hypothetical protein